MSLSEPVRRAAHALIDGVSVTAQPLDRDVVVSAATVTLGWLVHQLSVSATVSEEVVLFQLRAFIDSPGARP